MSKVLGNLIPVIAGDLWRRRAEGPTLTNTDGHALRFVSALVKVKNQAAAAKRLAAHHDFRTEENGQLTWWGRELSEMERQSALAHLRSHLAQDDEEPVEEAEEAPRLLRGRLEPREDGFQIEVNSEERLTARRGF